MSWDENELKRALAARAEHPELEFRVRLAATLEHGRQRAAPTSGWAIAAAVAIALTVIGMMMGPRLLGSAAPGGVKPSPTSLQWAQTPSPQAWPSAVPSPPSGGPLVVLPTSVWLSAPSPDILWAEVGGGSSIPYLFRSQDGGATWEMRSMPQTQLPLLGGPAFVDAILGWRLTYGFPATQCQAEMGTVLHTEDGGATWQDLGHSGIGDSQCITGIQFVDPSHGFIGAGDPNHAPVIYRTTDGGRTWTPSSPLPDPPGRTTGPAGFELLATGPLARVEGVLYTGVAIGGGTPASYVYRSADGGMTWSYAASLPSPGEVTFGDASHWWVSGSGLWAHTSDSGHTWSPAPPAPYVAAVPPSVLFVDTRVGYVETRGLLWRTTDGGRTWVPLKTPGT